MLHQTTCSVRWRFDDPDNHSKSDRSLPETLERRGNVHKNCLRPTAWRALAVCILGLVVVVAGVNAQEASRTDCNFLCQFCPCNSDCTLPGTSIWVTCADLYSPPTCSPSGGFPVTSIAELAFLSLELELSPALQVSADVEPRSDGEESAEQADGSVLAGEAGEQAGTAQD